MFTKKSLGSLPVQFQSQVQLHTKTASSASGLNTTSSIQLQALKAGKRPEFCKVVVDQQQQRVLCLEKSCERVVSIASNGSEKTVEVGKLSEREANLLKIEQLNLFQPEAPTLSVPYFTESIQVQTALFAADSPLSTTLSVVLSLQLDEVEVQGGHKAVLEIELDEGARILRFRSPKLDKMLMFQYHSSISAQTVINLLHGCFSDSRGVVAADGLFKDERIICNVPKNSSLEQDLVGVSQCLRSILSGVEVKTGKSSCRDINPIQFAKSCIESLSDEEYVPEIVLQLSDVVSKSIQIFLSPNGKVSTAGGEIFSTSELAFQPSVLLTVHEHNGSSFVEVMTNLSKGFQTAEGVFPLLSIFHFVENVGKYCQEYPLIGQFNHLCNLTSALSFVCKKFDSMPTMILKSGTSIIPTPVLTSSITPSKGMTSEIYVKDLQVLSEARGRYSTANIDFEDEEIAEDVQRCLISGSHMHQIDPSTIYSFPYLLALVDDTIFTEKNQDASVIHMRSMAAAILLQRITNIKENSELFAQISKINPKYKSAGDMKRELTSRCLDLIITLSDTFSAGPLVDSILLQYPQAQELKFHQLQQVIGRKSSPALVAFLNGLELNSSTSDEKLAQLIEKTYKLKQEATSSMQNELVYFCSYTLGILEFTLANNQKDSNGLHPLHARRSYKHLVDAVAGTKSGKTHETSCILLNSLLILKQLLAHMKSQEVLKCVSDCLYTLESNNYSQAILTESEHTQSIIWCLDIWTMLDNAKRGLPPQPIASVYLSGIHKRCAEVLHMLSVLLHKLPDHKEKLLSKPVELLANCLKKM